MNQFAINTSSVNPSILGIEMPAERFSPTIHKMDQVDAMEQVALLRDHSFDTIGQVELHSGIHPIHGKCIVMISDAHASIIPFA